MLRALNMFHGITFLDSQSECQPLISSISTASLYSACLPTLQVLIMLKKARTHAILLSIISVTPKRRCFGQHLVSELIIHGLAQDQPVYRCTEQHCCIKRCKVPQCSCKEVRGPRTAADSHRSRI